jgi:hypothetical protein
VPIAGLVEELPAPAPYLIVLEATGGLESSLLDAHVLTRLGQTLLNCLCECQS